MSHTDQAMLFNFISTSAGSSRPIVPHKAKLMSHIITAAASAALTLPVSVEYGLYSQKRFGRQYEFETKINLRNKEWRFVPKF